jgi:GAF domain-containing protein
VDFPHEFRLAQLLDELALAVSTDESLIASLDRLARAAVRLIPHCSGASVSMLVEGRSSMVCVTDRVALQIDLVQYDNNKGPSVITLTGDAIRIGFVSTGELFPDFAIGVGDQRVVSALCTPAIADGMAVGSLSLYSQRAEAFDHAARRTAEGIAAEVATALITSSVCGTAHKLREQVQLRHDERTLVSQAQGVLMTIHACSANQAADLLRNAAADNSEPLIATAERILATLEPVAKPTE